MNSYNDYESMQEHYDDIVRRAEREAVVRQYVTAQRKLAPRRAPILDALRAIAIALAPRRVTAKQRLPRQV